MKHTEPKAKEPKVGVMIDLKYPLILVHGAGFRDKTFGVNYWGRIPRYFGREGITVYYGGTDSWGSIESNGELLKKTILGVLEKTGAKKVNILAHSRGGLEARYCISALGMETSVASLTTMSTPHHGAEAMNIALKFPILLYRFISVFVDGWSKLLGDSAPDFYRSSLQLSESQCSEFNRKYPEGNLTSIEVRRRVPNMDGIYYQSYATVLRFFFGDLMYLFTWIMVRVFDGPNDGLCPVESAKWANFRGIISGRRLLGVSHGGILDLYRLPFRGVRVIPPSSEALHRRLYEAHFSIPELYLFIIRELAEMGY